MAVNKVYSDATAALAGVLRDDMTIMSGGFGLCGIPSALIEAIHASGVTGLTSSRQTPDRRCRVGRAAEDAANPQDDQLLCRENATFAQQYLAGELEIEFNPQERWPSGFVPVGLAFRRSIYRDRCRDADRRGQGNQGVRRAHLCDGAGLHADLAVIHAWKADPEGNLITERRRGTSIDHGYGGRGDGGRGGGYRDVRPDRSGYIITLASSCSAW